MPSWPSIEPINEGSNDDDDGKPPLPCRKSLPKEQRRVGYLMSLGKKRGVDKEIPQSTPSYTITPLPHKIMPAELNDDTCQEFFRSLITLRNYIHTSGIDLIKLNDGIQQMAFHSVFPKVEWLKMLVTSDKVEDIDVSTPGGRSIPFLVFKPNTTSTS